MGQFEFEREMSSDRHALLSQGNNILDASKGYAAEHSPPQPRRGGRDIKKISRSHSCGADGVVLVRKSWPTPPRLRDKEASQLFLTSRSHPSSAEEGNACPHTLWMRQVC